MTPKWAGPPYANEEVKGSEVCIDSGPVGVGRMELHLPGLSTSLYREGSGAPSTGIKNRVLVAQNMLRGHLQAPYSLPGRKG